MGTLDSGNGQAKTIGRREVRDGERVGGIDVDADRFLENAKKAPCFRGKRRRMGVVGGSFVCGLKRN